MRRATIVLVLFLLGISVVRLLLASQIGLIPDEAYYWAWSLQPDWCYWDQPAGIAWVHWAWGKLFGSSLLSIRGLAVFCSLLASLLIYGWLKRVFGERSALWSVIVLNFLPLFAVGSVLMLHDSVLLVFGVAAWWAFTTALAEEKPKIWLLVGFFLSMAIYAKFTALLLAGGFFLTALFEVNGRRQLRTPWPYLGGTLAVILVSPIILWNVKHDWTAIHAVRKLSIDPDVVGWHRIASVFEYIGGQLGVVTPILAVIGLMAALEIWRRRKKSGDPARMTLLVPAIILLVYFLINSARVKIQANWPAMAWVALVPLGVDWVARKHLSGKRQHRKWLAAGVALAVVGSLLIHVQVFYPLAKLQPDITDQFYGWRGLAQRVQKDLAEYNQPVLMTKRYQIASELLYHMPQRPQVYTAAFAHRGSQFTLWRDYSKLIGRDVLYVDPQSFPGKLSRHFASVEELEPFYRLRGEKPVEMVRVYRARNFHWSGPLESYFSDPVRHQVERIQRRRRAK